MKKINEQLYAHYSANQAGIEAIFAKQRKDQNTLDGPHLLYCWEEAYFAAKYKILVLGQENNTWNGLSEDVDVQIDFSKWFEHAKDYDSPYWQYVHFFNEGLNGATSDRLGFVASNVCKYCSVQGGPITEEENRFVVGHLNLLPGELRILEPDVVLFLSGPRYDSRIRAQLGEELRFEPIIDGIAPQELARMVHPFLPVHSYRTYHPGHLSRKLKKNYLQLIAATIKGRSVDAGMRAYQRQMQEIAEEFELLLEEPDRFPGNVFEGFYFYRLQWKWCGIGFEFEANGAGNFFYGICRKDSGIDVPAGAQEQLLRRLPVGDGSTAHWPWWRWFEHRDWNDMTLEEIGNGKMKKKIRAIVSELLSLLDGAAI